MAAETRSKNCVCKNSITQHINCSQKERRKVCEWRGKKSFNLIFLVLHLMLSRNVLGSDIMATEWIQKSNPHNALVIMWTFFRVITKNLLALARCCAAWSVRLNNFPVRFVFAITSPRTHKKKHFCGRNSQTPKKKKAREKALSREVLIYDTGGIKCSVIHLTSRAWFRKLIWILWRLISPHAYLRRAQRERAARATLFRNSTFN